MTAHAPLLDRAFPDSCGLLLNAPKLPYWRFWYSISQCIVCVNESFFFFFFTRFLEGKNGIGHPYNLSSVKVTSIMPV